MSVRDLIPWTRNGLTQSDLRESVPDPLFTLHRDMNRLFDDVFRSLSAVAPAAHIPLASMWPRVEVADSENEIKVTAEVPGLDEKDVEVLLEDGVLTLRGEKRAETTDEARRISERFYGHFERRLVLTSEVEEDKIVATFKNGVLSVVMPKNPNSKSRVRRIEVSH